MGAMLAALFSPFETWLSPLDIPATPMPDATGAWGSVLLIWHFARKFRRVLVVVGLLATISALISLALVWSLAFVVDGVSERGAAAFVREEAWVLGGLVVLFAIVDPLVSFVRQAFQSQTVQTLMPAALRWQAHRAVEGQDVAFFEDLFAGQVASRIAQVTGAVQGQLSLAMQTVPRVVIQFAGSVALLLALAPLLAVPVVIWMTANVVLAWHAVPLFLARSGKVAAATARATGAMTDIYANIALVKLFAAERGEADAVRAVIGETISTQHAENRAYVVVNTITQILNVALTVSVFALGLWGLVAQFVSAGEFVAAVTVAQSLSNSSFAFIGLGQSVTRALGTIRDAAPVITSRPKVADAPGAGDLVVTKGAVGFERVGFAYREGVPVIRDLDLAVAPGEKVGLVGLSGAGKSTLVALLMRLRDVDGGRVTIDGQDVRDVTQESLRRAIGVVTQDVALLHRSVGDNVRLGRAGASDGKVRAALEAAEAWDFVRDLVDGEGRRSLDAHVGERGVKLSGGQRQRVAIARAFLKDAPILVLDEATSALDSQAEAAIQASLDRLMAGKSVIAIAHRLSTVAAMDRLVVIDAGRIVEQGSHRELIARGGLYASLWARQSGGFLAAAAA